MMFQWKPDMVRFMRAASEYNTYNQELTQLMRPYLTKKTHICDVGCGLGYLSLALAPYVGRVTAVDANADALRVLEENRTLREIHNLQILHGDVFHMRPTEPYDSMAFCFFGQIGEIFSIAKKQCRGKVFAFKRNYRMHRFSVSTYESGNDSYQNACAYLREKKIPFEGQELSLELGQPFRDLSDARLFFETYNRGDAPVTNAFLRERVVETGREDFPLYMPHKRDIGWLVMDVDDIPEEYFI